MPADQPIESRFAGRRCLVTGGLGFIGSNLVHRLVTAGVDVTVVDALVPQHGGDRANVPDDVGVTIASVGDPAVADALAGIDTVFNVAGQVSHHESMLDPMRDLELNVTSQLRFLEMIRATAPGAVVVQTSTRQVYGRPQYLPVDELHPTNPIDVNGVDKLACEQFHLVYAKVHGLRASALRLTNVYGPRQHLGHDGLGFLPVFVRRALAGDEIELYGDGSQLRDCLHVDDIVDALLLAASTPDAEGEVFNLGHSEVLPLSEIARLTIAGAAAPIDGAPGDGAPGGPTSSVRCVAWPDQLERIDIGSFHGDFGKARRVLGWEPRIAFADGIAATLAWYRTAA